MQQADNQDSRGLPESQPEVVIDLLELVQRHYPILLMTMAVFTALGAIYCLVADSAYQSMARVQIKSTKTPVFNEQSVEDRSALAVENELETHKLVINSPLIIDRAVRDHNLMQLEELRNVAPDDLLEHWEEHLTVALPEEHAAVLTIAYEGASPEDCQKIVDAIVDAYQKHLGDESAELGEELASLIKKGKNELLEQLKEQEAEYSDFQRTSPLLWREGEGINLYQERQMEIETKRKELVVEKSLLEAKIESVSAAVDRGGDWLAAVYYEAMLELKGTEEQEDTIAKESSRGYGLELSREYMDLLARESELSIEFGDGYPELVALRAKIAQMRVAVEASIGRDLESDGLAISAAQAEQLFRPEIIDIYVRMLLERRRALELQIAKLGKEFELATEAAKEVQAYIATDRSLRAGQERTQKMFDAVVSRLEEINIIEAYGGETMQILAKASRGEQVWPSVPIVMALSLVFGGMFGVGWATLRMLTSHVFKDPTEIRRLLGVPVLGQIPMQKASDLHVSVPGIDPMVAVVHNSGSRCAEAFRGVRTAVHFSTRTSSDSVLQVTSPTPGDGKSTTAANLSVSFANTGKSVLLIDADMRRPNVHELFGIGRAEGLVEVLRGDLEWQDATKSTGIDGLEILTAGCEIENPSELLTYDTFDHLLEIAKEHYDLVLIDSPPLLAVSDPAIVAPRVDGVLLVVRIRHNVRAAAERAGELLREVGANLLGTIVNGLRRHERGFGYGGYRAGYSYGYGYRGSDSYYGGPRSNGMPAEAVEPTNGEHAGNGSAVHTITIATQSNVTDS